MKNAKKLLLLLLSLVLLIGVFTIATLADDAPEADAATVVYPDGTVDAYTAAGAITPSIKVEDGLFYGKGKTLYKDAGAGWIYTDEAGNTVVEITDDLIAAGAKITASGFDKVYATVDITIAEGDYVICLNDTDYVMAGTTTVSVAKYDSTAKKYVVDSTYELDEAARKIPVGTHKLYLTEADAVRKFLNHATCSFEIDGVTYNYQDIRSRRANSAKITLYEDNSISAIGWDRNGADRPATTIADAVARAGSNYPASVLLDLNGHNLASTTTSFIDVMGMILYIYSSKAGAHYDATASTTSMFRTNDDAAIVLGDDNNAETAYYDNIYFHCKAINEYLYGTGIAINGGHFYQSAPSANGMFNVSRRVGLDKGRLPELQYTIENASFYLLPGSNAVLNNATPSGVGVTIKNCAFYTSDAASLVYTAARTSNAITVTADGCSFYGVTKDYIAADEATKATLNITNDVAVAEKVTYNTVTWFNGTTSYYYATSLEEAKAFVENHPNAKIAIAPHEVLSNNGKTMHYIYEPVSVIEYDELTFNAVRKDLGEQTKIYFTTENADGIVYHAENNAHSFLTAANIKKSVTMVLYEDVDVTSFSYKSNSSTYVVKVDLNGHNVTTQQRSDVTYSKSYIYSSKPGAHYYAEQPNGIAFANDGGTIYFGDDGSGNYADNITFHTDVITCYNYGGGAAVIGGHYYQTSARTAFLDVSRRLYTLKNASFYVYPGTKAVLASDAEFAGSPAELNGVASGSPAIDNCKFYSQDGDTPVLFATSNAKLKFTNCEFYGVSATVDGATGSVTADATNAVNASAYTYNTVTWLDGTKDFYVAKDLDAAKLFVETSKKYVDPASATEPYGTLREDGYYYYIETPNVVFAYDGAYNAAFTDDSEGVRAYYTVEVDGETTYHTDAATASTKLRAYLGAMDPGATITLWADVSIESVTVQSKQLQSTAEDEAIVESAKFWLDVNGYKLTITGGSAGTIAMDIKAARMYIYSSRAGGKIDVGNKYFFRSNNDEYNYTDPAGKSHNVKPSAYVYIGEKTASPTRKYADNLTVVCGQINPNMYGSSASIYGGTYVQAAGSTASYFLLMSRTGGAKHVENVYYATFVLSNPATSPLYYHSTSARSFTKCVFISPNQTGGVALSAWATPTVDATFSGCTFINVLPMYQPNGRTFTYLATCKYGTTSGLYSSANLNASTGAQYLAHSTTVSTITANGVTYELDGQIITDPSTALLLTREDVGTDYWMVGTTPPVDAGDFAELTDGVLKLDPVYDYASQPTYFENGKVIAAGEATILIAFEKQDAPAFVYTDMNTGLLYGVGMSDFENATAVGDKFYEIFSVPAAPYEIVLYTEMNLTKAMGFGPTILYSQGGFNRDYYDSLANGAITLDLNGQTLTIDASLVGINLSAANFEEAKPGVQNAYKPAVFALECSVERIFTLKSSVAGAQIINNSDAALFGVGEGDLGAYKILDEDNNITIRSKGKIFAGIESYGNTIFNVNGGTYYYEGTDSIANISRTVVLENATFICTNDVASIFTVDGYRYNNLTATNCVFLAPNAAKLMVKGAGNNSTFASANEANTSKFTFNSCDFINVNLTEKLTVNYKVSDVPTDFHAYATYESPNVSTDADLALAYAGADLTGLEKAYLNKKVNGVDYKLMGYYADGFATVNWGFGITENWLIGETATHDNEVIDGIFTYAFRPFTVAAENNTVQIALRGIETGVIQMSLTLQSYIGMNVFFGEALQNANITVMVDDEEIDTSKTFITAIAPNVANQAITFTIKIGDNTHTVPLGIDKYAKALINSDTQTAKAKNLTYAMVEYVRAMTGDSEFCNVTAPAGYDSFTLEGAASGNTPNLLTNIRFNLSGTIAIEVAGSEAAEGKAVNLVLATGRSEWGTIVDGSVVFTGLYVNEFFGNMTLTIEGETYTYSLANYLHGIIENGATDNERAGVQALYNYAYYANEYVTAMKNAENGNAENA